MLAAKYCGTLALDPRLHSLLIQCSFVPEALSGHELGDQRKQGIQPSAMHHVFSWLMCWRMLHSLAYCSSHATTGGQQQSDECSQLVVVSKCLTKRQGTKGPVIPRTIQLWPALWQAVQASILSRTFALPLHC